VGLGWLMIKALTKTHASDKMGGEEDIVRKRG
jgi:hypothetical protein